MPIKNGNSAANIAKYGAGVWNMTATGLAGTDWTGILELNAGTLKVGESGITRTIQVKGDCAIESASNNTMPISGISAIDSGKTLTVKGGQVALGTVRPAGTLNFSGEGNGLSITLAESTESFTLNVTGAITASQIYIYSPGGTEIATSHATKLSDGVLTVAPVVAQIGTAVYGSLQDAVDAVTDGGTITILANCGDAAVSGAKTSTDITAAFTVTAGENNTYTVALDGTKTVDSVKVAPEVDTTAETPFNVSASSVGLTMKTIPGLWYGMAASDTPNGTYTVQNGEDAVKQATGASLTLSADLDPEATVKFYRVKTGASKAALDAEKASPTND